MKISVVIAAKNEVGVIESALESAIFADEIIIIDDNSTDDTANVSRSYNAKVYKRGLDGFATQKNFGIDKANNDWVLILDADERISAELKNEIQRLKPTEDVSAYSMPFKNYVGDKWLAHGGLYPDRHTRLFNRKFARYGEREIHEELVLRKGIVSPLKGDVIHLAYNDLREYDAKVSHYAKKEASLQKNIPSRLRPFKEFIRRYILLLGFLDGYNGLASAYLLARYQYLMRREAKK